MRPWCPLHGVTTVSAMGPHSGYSPWDGFWDGHGGAGPGAGQERCRAKAMGSPRKPSEQSTRGCARHRGACRWAQHRGHNHGESTHTPDTIAPAPRQPRHRHTPTRFPPACTHAQHRHRAVPTLPSRREPYRTLPSRTGPYRAARLRCAAPARAHSFTHAPWERAARATGGKRSPALAPPLPARMNERAPPSSILGHPALLVGGVWPGCPAPSLRQSEQRAGPPSGLRPLFVEGSGANGSAGLGALGQ